MSKRTGIILILAGLFILLINLDYITKEYLVLFIGLGLLALNFANGYSYTFLPGFVVTAVGLFNVLNIYFSVPSSLLLVFLGFAFLLTYLFDSERERWPLYPASALIFLGGYRSLSTLFSLEEYSNLLVPMVLIGIGVFVVIKHYKTN